MGSQRDIALERVVGHLAVGIDTIESASPRQLDRRVPVPQDLANRRVLESCPENTATGLATGIRVRVAGA